MAFKFRRRIRRSRNSFSRRLIRSRALIGLGSILWILRMTFGSSLTVLSVCNWSISSRLIKFHLKKFIGLFTLFRELLMYYSVFWHLTPKLPEKLQWDARKTMLENDQTRKNGNKISIRLMLVVGEVCISLVTQTWSGSVSTIGKRGQPEYAPQGEGWYSRCLKAIYHTFQPWKRSVMSSSRAKSICFNQLPRNGTANIYFLTKWSKIM